MTTLLLTIALIGVALGSLALKSLEILDISSASQFEQLLTVKRITNYGGFDIVTNGAIDPKIKEFVEIAIQQPNRAIGNRE